MSDSADKKREHEERAQSSLAETPPDFAAAFKHICRAAEHAIDLAEQQEGEAYRAAVEEAKRLLGRNGSRSVR